MEPDQGSRKPGSTRNRETSGSSASESGEREMCPGRGGRLIDREARIDQLVGVLQAHMPSGGMPYPDWRQRLERAAVDILTAAPFLGCVDPDPTLTGSEHEALMNQIRQDDVWIPRADVDRLINPGQHPRNEVREARDRLRAALEGGAG